MPELMHSTMLFVLYTIYGIVAASVLQLFLHTAFEVRWTRVNWNFLYVFLLIIFISYSQFILITRIL